MVRSTLSFFRSDIRSLGFQVTKKGLEGPLGRAPPRLAGGLSTPGGALRYENQRGRNQSTHGCALPSETVIYMHCGSAGQAKCGGNPARQSPPHFKRAFEIDRTGKTAIVN